MGGCDFYVDLYVLSLSLFFSASVATAARGLNFLTRLVKVTLRSLPRCATIFKSNSYLSLGKRRYRGREWRMPSKRAGNSTSDGERPLCSFPVVAVVILEAAGLSPEDLREIGRYRQLPGLTNVKYVSSAIRFGILSE